MVFLPHDMLWLDRPGAFLPVGERPAWLDGAWLAQVPLVVRREAVLWNRVPVGARGLERNQRCAGYTQAGAVRRCVSPAMLVRYLSDGFDSHDAAARDWPCVATLLSLAPRLNALGLDWGPVGSVGFWLATGQPVLRPTSDLDLVVRSPTRLDPALTAALCALQQAAACRLDIQVDTGVGGFALFEYAKNAGRVLLKTAHGPQLLADPWMALEAT